MFYIDNMLMGKHVKKHIRLKYILKNRRKKHYTKLTRYNENNEVSLNEIYFNIHYK